MYQDLKNEKKTKKTKHLQGLEQAISKKNLEKAPSYQVLQKKIITKMNSLTTSKMKVFPKPILPFWFVFVNKKKLHCIHYFSL